LGGLIAVLMAVVPVVYYRWEYATNKRLREVEPGRVYRSGHMTAEGFEDAVKRLNLRTIINLQDEYPDPDVVRTFFDRSTVKEKAMCERLGIRYVHIAPDLYPPALAKDHRPKAIDQFLAVMDDPNTYPVLIHCRAGLHRTGVMTAVYRMEYQGWDTRRAFLEVKDNGFGESACTSANEYIAQYVLNYRPRAVNSADNAFRRLSNATITKWQIGLQMDAPISGRRPLTPDP
jgi:protein tyrosine/serine phosphatase